MPTACTAAPVFYLEDLLCCISKFAPEILRLLSFSFLPAFIQTSLTDALSVLCRIKVQKKKVIVFGSHLQTLNTSQQPELRERGTHTLSLALYVEHFFLSPIPPSSLCDLYLSARCFFVVKV